MRPNSQASQRLPGMDEQAPSGRDSDRQSTPPNHPASLQTQQLDHRPPSQTSITPLPTVPESPLVGDAPSLDSPTARAPVRTSRSDTSAPATPASQLTVRAVTPDLRDHHSTVIQDPSGTIDLHPGSTAPVARPPGSLSPHRSPRASSNTLAQYGSSSTKRQGIVFSDDIADTFDAVPALSSLPLRTPVYRPRTHSESLASGTLSDHRPRPRVSSVSSTSTADGSAQPVSATKGPSLESLGYPLIAPNRASELQGTAPTSSTVVQGSLLTSSSSTVSISSQSGVGPTSSPAIAAPGPWEKRSSARRLFKRTSSRPTSPLISLPPSADSVPSPIPTSDANKLVMLIKHLGGRMRGEVEYQDLADDSWNHGIFYIEPDQGSLMYDAGDHGQFHTTLVADLRGCRVFPGEQPDRNGQFLELVNAEATVELVFRPLNPSEFDLWLATLIGWQQIRPAPGLAGTPSSKMAGTRAGSNAPTRDPSRQPSSAPKAKESAIIKVGKVMLWDKSVATTPADIVPPSARNLRSPQASWRRVSCILRGSGEVKLMTESNAIILSTIEMAQLARCAVQQLDKSVLDEEYCIAVFPIYAEMSTRLSLFRPLFIALDSRVAFEVWFVLLRAFAVPSIYFMTPSLGSSDCAIADADFDTGNDDTEQSTSEAGTSTRKSLERPFFRVEKSLSLRVTEAVIKRRTPTDSSQRAQERPKNPAQQVSLVGNYLAEVILDGEVRSRTTTKSNTKNPFWREECKFVDLPYSVPYLSVVLKAVEENIDNVTHQLQASLGLPKTGDLREVAVGSVDIPLGALERGEDHEQWFPVCDDQKDAVGSMFVKVQYEELAVLAADEYKPLLNMLHKFGSSLTLQIAEVMHSRLRRLASVFLDIFQVCGTADDWLMAMIEDEIDGIGNQTTMNKMRFSRRLRSAESMESSSDRELIVRDMGKSLQGEANLLFRGNSLLTQSLEFHMRRLGKEYLEEVLSDKIFEINEINPDCEVDPSKLPPGVDVSKHWERLMVHTTEVWECVISSASRFPTDLRHILKYIRAVAEDRYGDFLRTVAFTSVSGFLFLRFVCPAILNPKLFGLLRDNPRPRAQRTLTLIAKSMQALANLSTIGTKEIWMEPMNRFLTTNRQSVKDFIDAVCSIPAEKPHASPAVPASYSTPLTVMGRLPRTGREGFPSLPYLIDHSRSIAALVKFWVDAHPLTAPPHMYDGDLLAFNNICVELQARADKCLAHAAKLRPPTDAAESQAAAVRETLADDMEKATLADTVDVSYGNTPSWMESSDVAKSSGGSAGLAPPGSSGSDIEEHGSRQPKSRQLSFGGKNFTGEGSGSIKILRTRKFLSGIISRKPRPTSPEHIGAAGPSTTTRGHDRDRKDHGKDKERGQARDRSRDPSHKRAGSKGKPGESETSNKGKGKKDRSPGKASREAESKSKT